MFIGYIVVIRIITCKSFENINSPYPFEEVELKRFK